MPYAHDYKDHFVSQQYLPDSMVGKSFFEFSDQGAEADMNKRMKKIKKGEE